jgi:thiamine pyrophosphokinase
LANQRAVIFANGEITDLNSLKELTRAGDLIIAADGGLHHLFALGVMPSALIGDLDSVTSSEVEKAREQGTQVIKYPVDKNETDLQLAIQYAIAAECSEIIIAAALGGRLDQTLGNIFLLMQPALRGINCRLDDGREEVFLIDSSADITGSPGDVVSLLPVGEPVYDVKTEEMKYPLVYEKLFPDQTRGISNVMLSHHARITISRGRLICVHTRQIPPVT